MKNILALLIGLFVSLTSTAGVLTIPTKPLLGNTTPQAPLNMLVLGKDHKLFYESYNDTSDLDGDGTLDVGYKGYELKKSPQLGESIYKIDYYGYFDSYKCYGYKNNRFEPDSTTSDKTCSGKWSGDFLNYLTTSRIDALRKVLYGGKRFVDTTTETVLERAFIPQDAHSWGKEYTSKTVDGYNISDYTPLSNPDSNKRHLFASTTLCGGSCSTSYTQPPVLRYIKNSDRRIWEWVSIERPVADNQYADGSNQRKDIEGIQDLTVRVLVCKAGLEESNCISYSGGKKPGGLLQKYGSNDAMRFGLYSGSYSNNLQGGVLRKNIGNLAGEIDFTTGVFIGSSGAEGIVRTFDNLRVEGFSNSREYFGQTSGDDACDYGNAFANRLSNGRCSGWGNPLGEILFDAVRYFAGEKSPLVGSNSDGKGNALNLPSGITWQDPYGADHNNVKRNNWCAKPAVTILSDISPSYDNDVPDSTFNGISFNRSSILSSLWGKEFGGSKTVIIGSDGDTQKDLAPTPKLVSSFARLHGLFEEPGKEGTFNSAAIADFARRNPIRSEFSYVNPNNSQERLTQGLSFFSIAMASPLPKINIPLADGKVVTFVPFAKSPSNSNNDSLNKDDYRPTNQIVDFYIDTVRNVDGFPKDDAVNGGRAYYKFRINFEDLEYGGDHDMDAIAEYEMQLQSDSKIKVVVKSTYAAGGIDQHMGYVVSGTTKDGVYLVVKDKGGNDVKYWMDASPADTANPSGKPLNPVSAMSALSDTRVFTPSTAGSMVTELKSPLWYVAKYGGFVDIPGAGRKANEIDDVAEWSADGKTPDNYFLVSNPLKLEEQLDKAFRMISMQAGAAAAGGSNSRNLIAGSLYFRVGFRSENWEGELLAQALSVDSNKNLVLGSGWSAHQLLKNDTGRQIIVGKGSRGAVPFLYGQAGLPSLPALSADLIAYLRGNASKEGTAAGAYRQRPNTKLGDIHGSSPVYVDYGTSGGLVFVGANDGMLHVFDAKDGSEKLGFIPNAVVSKLPELAKQSYGHEFYVDATPTAAKVGSQTLLAGGLGAGGQAWYLLDISNPENFTESKADSLVKWELSSTDSELSPADRKDIGYSYGRPHIVKLNDGKYWVLLPNGYNSENGKAGLLIVPLDRPVEGWGTSIIKIMAEVAVTAPATAPKNGLSNITPYDLNKDGKVDVVYGGDLEGNVWRFDLSGAGTTAWAAAKPSRLFTAKGADGKKQAIIAAPAVASHPAYPSNPATIANPGLMVMVGTGKFIENCDKAGGCTNESASNTVYGLWDAGIEICNRNELLEQTLGVRVIDGKKFRTVTNNQTNWASAAQIVALAGTACTANTARSALLSNHLGWREDLNISGERIVDELRYESRMLQYQTYIPATIDSDPCLPRDESFMLRVNYNNGGRFARSRIDDPKINGQDVPEIVGLGSSGSLGSVDIRLGGIVYSLQSSTTGQSIDPIKWRVGRTVGQVSWRELINTD
ncbi:pilus assembly protein [Craterilacuibacter sinensis]|nr:PilC/PilY family type IV pilus protein [Craterilacuibacter sinensis]